MRQFILLTFLLLVACQKMTTPLETTKQGESSWFMQRENGLDTRYTALCFADNENGWIVGYNGVIEHTSDGGYTWKVQNSSTKSKLWDIYFVDKNVGFACGDSNTIIYTDNKGKNWQDISIESADRKIYSSIHFLNKENGWTVNNHGELYKTNDSGKSWELNKLWELGGSACLSVLSEEIIFAYHHNELFKSFNSGQSWDSLIVNPYMPTYRATSLYFLNDQHGWMTTMNGTGMWITEYPIYRTSDGGLTWFSSDSLYEEGGFWCSFFLDQNIGWVSGYRNVYKTLDGGKSWDFEYSPDSLWLDAKEIQFTEEGTGWILSSKGGIYKFGVH